MLSSTCCITILFKREPILQSFTEEKQFNSNIKDTVQNLLICLQSLKVNAAWSNNYPIKIFYDDAHLGLFEIQYILSNFPNTSFHVFPAEDPPNFSLEDRQKLDSIIESERAKGRATRTVGYRRMCYWYSYLLWRHPALNSYDYIMRMDTDSVIWSKCDFDFFQVAKTNGLDYLYRVLQKVDTFSDKLHELTNDFLGKLGIPNLSPATDIRSLSSLNTDSDFNLGYNYVFNNFFVAKTSLFKHGTTAKLLDHLVRTKNIYFKRWGDANLHSILLQLPGVQVDQITNYGEFDYGKWGLVWKNGVDERDKAEAVPNELFNKLSLKDVFDDFAKYLALNIDDKCSNLKNLPSVVNHRFQSTLKSCFLKNNLTNDRVYTNQQLSSAKSVLSDLKGSFLGHEAVVLTCGPSLADYTKQQILDFCKGKLIVSVKEAFLEFPSSHLWFVNDSRWQKFSVSTTSTLAIYTHAIHETAFKASHSDVFYDVYLQEAFSTKSLDVSNQLINKQNYNDYAFDSNILRPWGPGILYESVFYFLQHLGIRNCYTLGWDLFIRSIKPLF